MAAPKTFRADMSGFDEFEKQMVRYAGNVDKIDRVLEEGAKTFVQDLLKLPSPKSRISTPGYTHLIETFAWEKNRQGSFSIGWGKYYGPMVEKGTAKMGAHPHLVPLWVRNQERYYREMAESLFK